MLTDYNDIINFLTENNITFSVSYLIKNSEEKSETYNTDVSRSYYKQICIPVNVFYPYSIMYKQQYLTQLKLLLNNINIDDFTQDNEYRNVFYVTFLQKTITTNRV